MLESMSHYYVRCFRLAKVWTMQFLLCFWPKDPELNFIPGHLESMQWITPLSQISRSAESRPAYLTACLPACLSVSLVLSLSLSSIFTVRAVPMLWEKDADGQILRAPLSKCTDFCLISLCDWGPSVSKHFVQDDLRGSWVSLLCQRDGSKQCHWHISVKLLQASAKQRSQHRSQSDCLGLKSDHCSSSEENGNPSTQQWKVRE